MNAVAEIITQVDSRTREVKRPEVLEYLDRLILGDCVKLMRNLPDECVDLIVTDPPYVVKYCDRSGRRIFNDDNSRWVYPAFFEAHRVLKNDAFCFSFYGWNKADKFLAAWKECGFTPVGHFTCVKNYSSSVSFTKMEHECAYLLVKGRPQKPERPPGDVLNWNYTGNKFHPTQKPLSTLTPIIEAFSKPGDVVLDPFGGSGSTAVAARLSGRHFVLFEQDEGYLNSAKLRLLTAAHKRDRSANVGG